MSRIRQWHDPGAPHGLDEPTDQELDLAIDLVRSGAVTICRVCGRTEWQPVGPVLPSCRRGDGRCGVEVAGRGCRRRPGGRVDRRGRLERSWWFLGRRGSGIVGAKFRA